MLETERKLDEGGPSLPPVPDNFDGDDKPDDGFKPRPPLPRAALRKLSEICLRRFARATDWTIDRQAGFETLNRERHLVEAVAALVEAAAAGAGE